MPRSVAAHVAGAEAKVSKHGKVEGIRQQAQPSCLANKNLYSVDSALSAARHATLPAVPLSPPPCYSCLVLVAVNDCQRQTGSKGSIRVWQGQHREKKGVRQREMEIGGEREGDTETGDISIFTHALRRHLEGCKWKKNQRKLKPNKMQPSRVEALHAARFICHSSLALIRSLGRAQ